MTPPIQMSVMVPLPPHRAFELFTERMSTWWPLATHSISKSRAGACFIEPFEGGRVFERSMEGEELEWGRIVVWEPPYKMTMTWYPGRGPTTEVEVRFTPADDGTLVELEHRGWQAYGPDADSMRSEYMNGWPVVFGQAFADAARTAQQD
jgi:hypothetical protein